MNGVAAPWISGAVISVSGRRLRARSTAPKLMKLAYRADGAMNVDVGRIVDSGTSRRRRGRRGALTIVACGAGGRCEMTGPGRMTWTERRRALLPSGVDRRVTLGSAGAGGPATGGVGGGGCATSCPWGPSVRSNGTFGRNR